MKKISVAFDGLKFSKETMKYAIDLAAGSKALLSGVFLDEFLYHSYTAYDMMESIAVRGINIAQLEQQDQNTRQQSIAIFNNACAAQHLNYVIHHDRSFALEELLKESLYSDLLVIGAGESFNHYRETAPSPFMRHLLGAAQCPVLVVPDKYRATERVTLLYDGKPSSVFAIKMFNLIMPWMRDLKIEIITVLDPKDRPQFPNEPLIKEFVNCHYPDAKYTLLQGDPEEQIPAYLRNYGPGTMVVLGAYERSQVSRWFKTSMADILINELSVPLLIAHPK